MRVPHLKLQLTLKENEVHLTANFNDGKWRTICSRHLNSAWKPSLIPV